MGVMKCLTAWSRPIFGPHRVWANGTFLIGSSGVAFVDLKVDSHIYLDALRIYNAAANPFDSVRGFYERTFVLYMLLAVL